MPKTSNPTNHFHRDIIVIGAFAGGVEALMKMTNGFWKWMQLSSSSLHAGPNRPSLLYDLLHRQSQGMRVTAAENDLAIEHGHMYVSVPDYHLVLEPDSHAAGSRTRRETAIGRPSTPLFRSAAKAFGPRADRSRAVGLSR